MKYIIIVILIIISCTGGIKHSNISEPQIYEANSDSIGWYKTFNYNDRWGRGIKSKIITYKYYASGNLIEYIEVESVPGDTMKVLSINIVYSIPEYSKYEYIWIRQLNNTTLLSNMSIQHTPNSIDTIYYFYPDKSVKEKSIATKLQILIDKQVFYKQGEYFIDLQRIDTLPGVIPTDYYYIME